ncbi:GmrSD restriction endonuclease domain-containing protein [Flintibacter faecis]|uniref:DUF262 domain-containing protein n=1 Tax=Flintibacter faecis TaxID=2763047 RepID=A0A8J6J675_9FIRM|nr:DUF262 domain-containing protein [Flintibacter faecis]MBC5717612.1 DUF262 domain-containing protein [Flintibacter faecis]
MSSELRRKSVNEVAVTQYDISVIPNDFNITTIFNLIDSGAVEMPVFQRNYIWDKKRASRFIESLILGLPVPQIFLYQKERNKFLVIDGQQRLLSIYYYIKQRFPLVEKRAELRKVFDLNNGIPDSILFNDMYFQDFKLQLSKSENGEKNPLDGLRYNTLGLYKSNFEFMTIRCMAIRQNEPKEDDSSVFEIFSRLNTGGVNLSNQEIRACLYYSDFFRILNILNQNSIWRNIYGKPEDGKFRDVEIILRLFALLCDGENYSGSMNGFINRFAKKAMNYSTSEIEYFENLFTSFLESCSEISRETFATKKGEFNGALFDSVFVATVDRYYKEKSLVGGKTQPDKINALKKDVEFEEAITHSTSHTKMVKKRLEKAREYLQ